ncbi:MAG: toll/interleukin-1 receptor domain-containing protein, partial [Acidobacteriota bacterium]
MQLLGRANPSTDYALTDADVLEFVHRFQRDNQPDQLLNTLRQQHILLVGSGFSDWLTRFLLRLARADRLWMNRGFRHFFADREATRDPRLRSFLEHPLTTAAVFQTSDATAFVDELHRRWQERRVAPRPKEPVAASVGPQPPAADGGVFLSYAMEDLASARRVNDRLRAAGIDVWFDKTGFAAGDDWDRVIRTRSERCFLFVPLLSQHTRASEGYYYKEWRLAEARAGRLAFGAKFAFPIVVDDSEVDSTSLSPALQQGAVETPPPSSRARRPRVHPRARGRLQPETELLVNAGCIPARAGETGCSSGCRSGRGVHPRARGGDPVRRRQRLFGEGASPRAR